MKKMNKPLVAILGCGPSGLLAAHACAMNDVPFVIISDRPTKSRLGGAQYSHIPIPGIHNVDEPEAMLTYIVRGDADTYQKKVYGSQRVPFVSFGNVKDGLKVPAWALDGMYDSLWKLYGEKVVVHAVSPDRVKGLRRGFDLMFSSAPLINMCMGTVDVSVQHQFRSQPIRLINETLDPSLPDNTILYDGTDEHSYYRMSKIFGVGATEWGAGSPTPPIKDLRDISKPIWTNCDCHKKVIRIGRFGTWEKGELTFHAFNRVIDTLAKEGAVRV